MQIETWALTAMQAAPYNPRQDLQPGDPEYERLKKSIQAFDYIDPIIVNRRTGSIVGGHQRWKILRALGYTEAAVSVVDLDETQEKALNVALNKTGGDWDDRKLAALLHELSASLDDLEMTGFGAEDLEVLLQPLPSMTSLADLNGLGAKDVEQLTLIVHLGDAERFRGFLKSIAAHRPEPNDPAPMSFALEQVMVAYERFADR